MTGAAAVTVSSGPTGSGSIGGPSQMCLGQEETFTVTGITGATSYAWTLPDGVEAVAPSTTASITVVITSEVAGVNLIAVPSNDCGAGTPVQKPLSSLPVPNAQIVAPTESIQIGEAATFDYTSSSTISGVFWSFGDGQTSQDQKPSVTYAAAGNFNVDLEVTDNNGCTNTVREPIVVLPEAALSDFAVKNVITPNGDGMNDFLYIENIEEFPDNEVIVLDRWGSEVFRKKNYDNSFEMKKGDQYLPAGNYVCVLKSNGKSYTRTITVLKQN
jgi:gliding motility-associated-like protein